MNHVLIVTYYFPPSGGPGVQRVLKFTKYLREFGWQPIILAPLDADYNARDESLLDEIPDDVLVHRAKIVQPYRLYRRFTGKKSDAAIDVNVIPKPGEKRSLTERIAEFVRATFFIPDAQIGWYRAAVREGLKIIHEQNVKMIYSSSPPYTCSVIARALKRKSGVPWVAGFRDPWRGFLSAPNRWFIPNAIERHLERRTFTDCDAMEVAWMGILKDFKQKYPGVATEKCHHLPNGFDSADFPSVEQKHNDRFTVTYTGTMYGKRNPETFLAAIKKLISERSIVPSAIRLRFVGRFGESVREMFNDPAVRECIEVIEYVPHGESVRLLFESDALLMIVDDFQGNEEIVPGKVFEYIGAKKPIITLAPEGVVADLIRETHSGVVARSHDVSSIASIVLDYYERWQKNTLTLEQRIETVKRYERREIARQLAAVFDSIADC